MRNDHPSAIWSSLARLRRKPVEIEGVPEPMQPESDHPTHPQTGEPLSHNASVLRAVDAFLGGDESAAKDLLPHVYDELRQVARGVIGNTLDGTVSPTVLVHEAFVKLSGRSDLAFASPAAFYSFTAKVMRSALVDHARASSAKRRGGGAKRVGTVSALADIELTDAATILSLNAALDQLAELSQRRARVVELRFFAGLQEPQIAEMLGVSRTTISSDWRFARAWLLKKLADDNAAVTEDE